MSDIHARRDALQQDCARQRDALSAYVAALQPVERIASPLWRMVRFLGKRPALSALLSLVTLRIVRRYRWARYAGSLGVGMRVLGVLRGLFSRR